MKKGSTVQHILLALLLVLITLTLSSCASLMAGLLGFDVAPPASSESSLLFVELVAYTEGQQGTVDDDVVEVNFTSGFFPVVVDENGKEVPFSVIEGMTEAGLVFYKENLQPGTYTMQGIRYLWMTDYAFMNSPIKDMEFDGQRTEWVERQFFALDEPVSLELKPGSTDSLGRYKAYFELMSDQYEKDPNLSVEDDENKAVLFRIESAEPENKETLKLMNNWTYEPWQLWNQRSVLK